MSHPSKVKGNRFEREIVEKAIAHGFEARRAWGSNGKAIGLHEEVDIEVKTKRCNIYLQAKIRARLPSYILPTEHVTAQVIRQDRGETYVVLRFDDYLQLIKDYDDKEQNIL